MMTCKDCINDKFCNSQCSFYYDHLNQECEMFCHNQICKYRHENAENCKGFKDKSLMVELPNGIKANVYMQSREDDKNYPFEVVKHIDYTEKYLCRDELEAKIKLEEMK